METKTGDEKFGHALHDDLTLSAICKKMKEKVNEGNRRVHVSRRAWRYHIGDVADSGREALMQRCAYVSRRTQLACKNYRPASKLTREGFCEVHSRFFRQLAQYSAAEQRRIEEGLTAESENVNIVDDDETLTTATAWPCSQQELFNDLFLDDDDDDPLKNAGVWTDEEVLWCELIALERKLNAIRDFRKLLSEKARRLAIFYRKKMAEERRKGKVELENERTRALRLANQKYHSSHSPKEQYMLRRLKARLEWDGSEEHKLDYLKVDSVGCTICTHVTSRESEVKSTRQSAGECGPKKLIASANSESREETVLEGVVEEDSSVVIHEIIEKLCEEVARTCEFGENLPAVVVFNGDKELNIEKGQHCFSPALPRINLCVKHVLDDPHQHLFAPCIKCGSLALDFGGGQNYCFRHRAKISRPSCDSLEQWETTTLQKGIVSMDNGVVMRSKVPAEQESSGKIGGTQPLVTSTFPHADNVNIGCDEPPIKFVIIDGGEDEEDMEDIGTNSETVDTPRQSENVLIQQTQPAVKRGADDDDSCARTRPFTADHFNKAKMRRGIGSRYPVSDVKDYLGNDLLLNQSFYRSQEQLSKSMVQDLLSGGPSKAAASASRLTFSGNRRISASGTSFSSQIGIRRTLFGPAANRSAVETPEMILGLTSCSAPATSSAASASSRPSIQRPILLRSRTSSSSTIPHQTTPLPPVNTSRYVTAIGASRPHQNWRNRSTLSLDSRIRRVPANAVSPMDYSSRPVHAASQFGPYIRRRDDRQFVGGNARSRLVALDSLSYTAPRVYPRPYPTPAYRQDAPRPAIHRPRLGGTVRKAAPSVDTLETAAAVASIAADLEAPTDQEVDEADDGLIGRRETSSWERVTEEPVVVAKILGPEEHSLSEANDLTSKSGAVVSGIDSVETSNNASIKPLSRQSSGDGEEDGLAVLAMAAASRAAHPGQSKKFKYGDLGLEEEDDDDGDD